MLIKKKRKQKYSNPLLVNIQIKVFVLFEADVEAQLLLYIIAEDELRDDTLFENFSI